MFWKRVTCQGKVRDLLGKRHERVFWLADIDGIWHLMTRKLSDEDVIDIDVLKERRLWSVGEGVYGGLDFVGSGKSIWMIVYSLNRSLFVLKTDGEVSRMLYYGEIGAGSYPYIFRNDMLEMYGLLSYSKEGWLVRFSSDFGKWSVGKSVNMLSDTLKKGFMHQRTSVSMYDFLRGIDVSWERDKGHATGFLT